MYDRPPGLSAVAVRGAGAANQVSSPYERRCQPGSNLARVASWMCGGIGSSMKALSAKLMAVVDSAEAILLTVTEEDSAKPALPGGWSRKQLIGDLIDSASNNHQRFVRAALQDPVTLPGYDQEGWSRVQFVQDAQWSVLIALWASYNRYLAHVIACLPAGKLDVLCHIGSLDPMTLRFVAEDYLHHLNHHLAQIGISI